MRLGLPSNPLNHCSKGASFLRRHVAGIQLLDDEPVYCRFRVAPVRGGWLSLTGAIYDARYGRIEAPWRWERERSALAVAVLPGPEAKVVFPVGRTEHHGPRTRGIRGAQVAGRRVWSSDDAAVRSPNRRRRPIY